MIKGDVFFFATAITDGDIMEGIKILDDKYICSTFALHKESKTNKFVINKYIK